MNSHFRLLPGRSRAGRRAKEKDELTPALSAYYA